MHGEPNGGGRASFERAPPNDKPEAIEIGDDRHAATSI
jgi:hypothetical protein